MRFACCGITSLTHGQIIGRGGCARYLEGDKLESQYQNGHGPTRYSGRRKCGGNAGSGPHSFLILAKALSAPGSKACLWLKETPAFTESGRVMETIRSFAGALSSSPYWPAHSPRLQAWGPGPGPWESHSDRWKHIGCSRARVTTAMKTLPFS